MTGKKNKIKMVCNLIKANIKYMAELALSCYRLIIDICLIVFPIGFIYFNYDKGKTILMIGILVIQLLLFLFKAIIMLCKNEKEGFPILNKRLTENVNGEIRIKKGNLQEAILYLYQVENYAERCGYMKK